MKDVISVDKAIVNYRIQCDIAVNDREELLISQEEYEEAIQFNLNRSKEDIHSLLISKLPTKKYVDMAPSLKTGSQTVTIPTYNEAIDDMHQVIDELFGVK